MRLGSLFTGTGGLDEAAGEIFGTDVVWTSDIDPAAAKIIAYRYPDVPNLGDITTVDWSQVEPVDVLTGGFPCQDLSMAGRRAGLRPGTRSGLWQHMAYAIDQLRPRYVVAENVRGLLNGAAHSDVEPCPVCLGDRPDGHMRALGAVLADLAELGYDAQWCGLRAADVGAPHGRFRVFIVAEDADSAIGDQRRLAAPRQAKGRRTRAATGGRSGAPDLLPTPTARDHKGHNQRRDTTCLTGALLPTPSSADGLGGHERRGGERGDELLLAGVAKLLPTPMVGSTSPASHGQISGQFRRQMDEALNDYGQYTDAINRWTRITGRPAPDPTVNGRLSPRFVEWMMGLPDGWVCDVPGLTRAQQLKALGNGVVPQQAAAALRRMLTEPAQTPLADQERERP